MSDPRYNNISEALSQKGSDMPATKRKDWKIWAGHCHQPPHHDKVYVVWIEQRGPTEFAVNGGYDARLRDKQLRIQPQGTYTTVDAAEGKMNAVIKSKSGDYKDIESPGYQPKLWTLADALKRIDTTRLVGYSQQEFTQPQPAQKVKVKKHGEVGTGKVQRSLEL